MRGMETVMEFFRMGGYGAFVWPAYGLAGVVLIAMLVASLRFLRTHESDLRSLEGNDQ